MGRVIGVGGKTFRFLQNSDPMGKSYRDLKVGDGNIETGRKPEQPGS